MAPNEEPVSRAVASPGRAVATGALWTLFYYVLLLAVMVYWQGSGLFLYEGF